MKHHYLFGALASLASAAYKPPCAQHDDCARAVAAYLADHNSDFCCHFLSGSYSKPSALSRWSDARVKAACRCLQPPTSCSLGPTSASTSGSTSSSTAPACRATIANGGFEAGLNPWSVETNGDTPYSVQTSNGYFRAHSGSKYFLSTCKPTGNACFTSVCQDICLEPGRTYDFSAYATERCNATAGASGCGSSYVASANFYISPVGGSDMVRLSRDYSRFNYSLAYRDASTIAQMCVDLTVEGVSAGEGLVALDDVRVNRK